MTETMTIEELIDLTVKKARKEHVLGETDYHENPKREKTLRAVLYEFAREVQGAEFPMVAEEIVTVHEDPKDVEAEKAHEHRLLEDHHMETAPFDVQEQPVVQPIVSATEVHEAGL
jgi:hypothetical protein